MNKVINKIMSIMDNIEYGFKDELGNNIKDTNPQKWEKDFFNTIYYLQTPEELLKSKCGVCWDQVELERKLFQENNIKFKTYIPSQINWNVFDDDVFGGIPDGEPVNDNGEFSYDDGLPMLEI